jgi:hypothetical protein
MKNEREGETEKAQGHPRGKPKDIKRNGTHKYAQIT